MEISGEYREPHRPDIQFRKMQTMTYMYVMTKRGKAWVDEHMGKEFSTCFGGGIPVDDEHAEFQAAAMMRDGLVIV